MHYIVQSADDDDSTQCLSCVICPPDSQLHLAPYEHGLGTNVLTLCLERWTRQESCREDSKFCPECFEKWSGNQPQEETNDRR